MKSVEKNNLYVELEKFQWKVRKVRFLEVVIRLDRIKIKEEKMKTILEWPALKRIKNTQKFLELVKMTE